MSQGSVLYRFRFNLSDVDRGVYEALDFRVAMHPSESVPYLLARVLAYALNVLPGLEFSPGGLSDVDAPAISLPDPRGGLSLCIEIGAPSTKRLHKAAKASNTVKVYTHRDPLSFLREVAAAGVHRAEEIEVFSFTPGFLDRLASILERDNRWAVVHVGGDLTVSVGDRSEAGEIKRHPIYPRARGV